jgi:hypothetical protein
VAQAPTKARILTVPGDGPDAREAGVLQGAEGLGQTVVVGHGHQDPIGLELAAGGGEDPADLGPAQAISEPVAQVAARPSVDRDVGRVGDDQIDRAIGQRAKQSLGRGQLDADSLGRADGACGLSRHPRLNQGAVFILRLLS